MLVSRQWFTAWRIPFQGRPMALRHILKAAVLGRAAIALLLAAAADVIVTFPDPNLEAAEARRL